MPMESFQIIIKKETYKITRSSDNNDDFFSVFNYATCHVIKRNVYGKWEAVKHRFGSEYLPLKEIGEAIDKYYSLQPQDKWPLKVKSKTHILK
jgi:hypothetical protein